MLFDLNIKEVHEILAVIVQALYILRDQVFTVYTVWVFCVDRHLLAPFSGLTNDFLRLRR